MQIYTLNGPAVAGIICWGACGKVDIDRTNYLAQMKIPFATWRCPICRGNADFDEARYEEINL